MEHNWRGIGRTDGDERLLGMLYSLFSERRREKKRDREREEELL